MRNVFEWMNENHWYVIAAIIITGVLLWIYGCESSTTSLITPGKIIHRDDLLTETKYILAQAKDKVTDLDKQDEIKRLILEQAAIFSTTGAFNPMGLLNTLISIGAISFGLNRNQKLNAANKERTPAPTG